MPSKLAVVPGESGKKLEGAKSVRGSWDLARILSHGCNGRVGRTLHCFREGCGFSLTSLVTLEIKPKILTRETGRHMVCAKHKVKLERPEQAAGRVPCGGGNDHGGNMFWVKKNKMRA